MANIDRTLGKLENAIEKLESIAKEMGAKLAQIENERAEERGGRKMLMLLGAAVATAWGIIGSFIGDIVRGLINHA